jgi:hypothetical protein
VTEWQVELDVSDSDLTVDAVDGAFAARAMPPVGGPARAEIDLTLRSSVPPWAARSERDVSDADRRRSGR